MRNTLNCITKLLCLIAVLTGTMEVRADFLYVANFGNNTVERFDTSAGSSGTVFANTGLSGPVGIAIGSDHDIYVANDNSHTIEKFTPSGTGSLYASLPAIPRSLAFDAGGNLYVASGAAASIFKATTGGSVSTFASGGSIQGPIGVALGPDSSLYVAEASPNNIDRFNLTTAVGQQFATTGLGGLRDLAFDQTGNLFVASGPDGEIEKITPGGVTSIFASGLSDPWGLAFDSQGDLFVACKADNTIRKITPSGTVSLFASSGLSSPTSIVFSDNSGNPLINPVPEPGSLALLGAFGLIAAAGAFLRPPK